MDQKREGASHARGGGEQKAGSWFNGYRACLGGRESSRKGWWHNSVEVLNAIGPVHLQMVMMVILWV